MKTAVKTPMKTSMKISMTKLGLLGAAAVVISSAIASPVLAQQVITDPGRCAQFYPDAGCRHLRTNNPAAGEFLRRSAYRTPANQIDRGFPYNGWHNNNGWNVNYAWHDDYGFWPR
jgi:hypothetical protein